MEKLKVFFQNLKSIHHRIMMQYLRKRGWVVFYLEPKARFCRDVCWLKLYEAEQARKSKDDTPSDIDPNYEAMRADLIP